MALRFLKANYLEKRLKGLAEIKTIIERIEYDPRERADRYFLEAHKVKPMKFMTAPLLKEWLSENRVVEIVLGENTHVEIVKRAGPVIKFLAKHDALPADFVDLLWKSQEGKHEEMVRVVYDIIKDVTSDLRPAVIDHLFEKIQSVPLASYDEKFLNFLKEFTQKGLEMHYDEKI